MQLAASGLAWLSRWTPHSPTAERLRGCGCSLPVPPLDRPGCPQPVPANRMAIWTGPALAHPPPAPQAGFATTQRMTPSVAGTAVGLAAGPADNRRLETGRAQIHQRPPSRRSGGDRPASGPPVRGGVGGGDIDLHARLCDVSLRGRSINISDGIVRLTDVDCEHRPRRRV